MSDIDLYERFPEMQPIRSVPPLSSYNGIGLAMHGSRDSDPETGTYVKTLCFTLLFIPLLALRAYRVANAPSGGWYFLGRVPLSTLAKLWNIVLPVALLAVGGGIYWHHYTNTPEYLAGQKLDRADELAKAGQYGKAAELCREVAEGKTRQAGAAQEKLKGLVADAADNAPASETAAALRVAVDLQSQPGPNAELFQHAMRAAERHAESDPLGAATVLDAVEPVAADPDALLAKKRDALERAVKNEPNDPDAASRLAVVYEAQNELAKCEPLLAPLAKRLGTSEGARILGHIYAQQDKLDQANALLQPYLESRLAKLHSAEKAYENARRNAEERVINELRNELRKGPVADFPGDRYEKANEAEQQAILSKYLQAKTKDDASIRTAQKTLVRELTIVPAALDYGIVLLRRAQTMRDEALRRAELEKAKKTFLAIRGVAGQDDTYRAYLGQVHYWLGEHAEGRKLFDELLEARQRSFQILISVSHILREVGAVSEARTLAEEAYNKGANNKEKQLAASGRATMFTDFDDEITWLRRADVSNPGIKGLLSLALGEKAIEEGKEDEAAQHLREAIAIYENQPGDPGVYNNGALACIALYQATGDVEALNKKMQMLEKALALRPSDSIIVRNVADSQEEAAYRDIVGSAIDFTTLKMTGSLNFLSYLYQDQAGKQRYVALMNKHAGLAKARAQFDRLIVLSPKDEYGYESLHGLYRYAHDVDALRGLLKRLESVELDRGDSERKMRDFLSGKDDDKNRKNVQAGQARLEAILQAARKKGGATLAVAATMLAASKMSREELNLPVNPDEIVALAEEAHAAAPSSTTQATLLGAVLTRAHRTLLKQEPAYAKMAGRAQRALGPSYILAVAISRDEQLRRTALENKDVQRALPMLKEQFARFPDAPSEFGWAILKAAGAPEADDIAKALQSEYEQVERELSVKLSPLSAATALQAYWGYQAAGQEAKGIEVLKQCAAQGVPLPFEP
jgi:hypothetical protein